MLEIRMGYAGKGLAAMLMTAPCVITFALTRRTGPRLSAATVMGYPTIHGVSKVLAFREPARLISGLPTMKRPVEKSLKRHCCAPDSGHKIIIPLSFWWIY